MTVSTPNNDKLHAAISSEITALAAVSSTAPHAQQSAQLANQRQIELVLSLIEHGHLNAATILSANAAAAARSPLATVITTLTTLAAGTTPAAVSAGNALVAAQAASVAELVTSGKVTAASVLSSQSYTGRAD